jgi:hypothetical protein
VFLCSDGVDDNYPVEENEKYLYKLYRTIALAFADDGFDSTCGQLKDLAESFATKGKGDDTSIAGIIDMEAVQAIAPLLRKQAEEDDRKAEAEKAARADEARAAAEKAARAGEARLAREKAEAEKVARPAKEAEAEKAARAEAARLAREKAEAEKAAKAETARLAREKAAERAEAAKRTAAESVEKSKAIEDALNAIEAHNKAASDWPDPGSYGDFVKTAGTVKIEITIKEDKNKIP